MANPKPKQFPGAKKPTERQRARELLLEGRSVAEVATLAGVSPTAVYKWRKERTFAERLEAAQATRLTIARDRFQSLAGRALDVMAEILEDVNAPTAVRLKAATEICDRAGITSKQAQVVVQTSPIALTPETYEQARRWMEAQPRTEGVADGGDSTSND